MSGLASTAMAISHWAITAASSAACSLGSSNHLGTTGAAGLVVAAVLVLSTLTLPSGTGLSVPSTVTLPAGTAAWRSLRPPRWGAAAAAARGSSLSSRRRLVLSAAGIHRRTHWPT